MFRLPEVIWIGAEITQNYSMSSNIECNPKYFPIVVQKRASSLNINITNFYFVSMQFAQFFLKSANLKCLCSNFAYNKLASLCNVLQSGSTVCSL